MNRRLFGTLGAMAVLVVIVSSCKKDPLSDLDGKPAAIVKQFSQMQIGIGDSTTFTASVVDGRFTPLAEPITFSSSAAAITVTTDTSYHPVPVTSARARVKGVSGATGYVIIQGGGLRDSVFVDVSATVRVADNTFTPAAITVSVGRAVTWLWQGVNPHNVIFAVVAGAPADIATITTGSGQRTFNTAGTFPYQCTLHAGMNGSVTVNP